MRALDCRFLIFFYEFFFFQDLDKPKRSSGSRTARCGRDRRMAMNKVMSERWRDYTHLAWEISPVLAFFLPVRLKNADTIIEEVCRSVRLKSIPVMHIPVALQYLVTTDSAKNAPEVLFL